MTKAEIAEIISRELSTIGKKEVLTVIDMFFDKVKRAMAGGEPMELRGFGTFGFKLRRPRMARNPHTNQPVPVPEHTVVHFKPGKEFKALASSVPVDLIRNAIASRKRRPAGS